MRFRLLTLSLVLAVCCVSVASATVLWDQSTPDPSNQGFINQVNGNPPFGYTIYSVDDIRVHDVWVIDSYTLTYWGIDSTWYLGAFQARLSIFPKTGSLPTATDIPTAEAIVNITAASSAIESGNVVTTLTAGGLGIMLTPGDYWIGLTTNATMQRFDWQGWRMSGTPWGDPAAMYDTSSPTWNSTTTNYGVEMDGCFKIEGTIATVPTDSKSFGNVKALFAN